MKSKRIFILLGHPDKTAAPISFALTNTYEAAAKAAGHDVRRMNLCEQTFDPILHDGYRSIQELEPDLKQIQENITWCEHFVLVYPNWWGGMPALLKGMWDRLFLPRFAFRMHKNRLGWDALLKGRTARVIIACGNPPLLDYVAFGDYSASIKRSLLQFAGFSVKVTSIGPSENQPETRVAKWNERVARLAKAGK